MTRSRFRGDDVVVRGGVKRTVEALMLDLEEAIDQGYGPVLSVFVGRASGTETYDDCLYRVCKDADIPNGQVQVSSIEALAKAKLPIVAHVEGDWPDSHCHVTFDNPVPQSQVEAFIEAFGEPQANPTGGRKAKK